MDNKDVYIHQTEFYSYVKKNMKFASKLMDLDKIIVNKITLIPKDKMSNVLPYM